ncbi:MAG TPA: hypothetical protein VFC19_25810 [Candidatus Limnocylindrales bacterium]|nr:hypothetical protein [Candidatus Limnocylindrales bacterium]
MPNLVRAGMLLDAFLERFERLDDRTVSLPRLADIIIWEHQVTHCDGLPTP